MSKISNILKHLYFFVKQYGLVFLFIIIASFPINKFAKKSESIKGGILDYIKEFGFFDYIFNSLFALTFTFFFITFLLPGINFYGAWLAVEEYWFTFCSPLSSCKRYSPMRTPTQELSSGWLV